MSRFERSGERDLGMSQWHRENFEDDADAFDVDLIGICHLCDQPLYAWETTRSTGYKPTKWLARVATMLNVPGHLIHYRNDDNGRVEELSAYLLAPFQSRREIGQALDLRLHIDDIRTSHRRTWHGRVNGT